MRMMKPSRFPVNPLLLALLLILLSAVGVMLYRFYRIKSFEEIITRQRALEFAVVRSYMRELQRLSLIVPVLKQLDTDSDEGLEQSILEAMRLFSEDGEIPHMISAMGYRDTETPDQLYIYDGEWKNTLEALPRLEEMKGPGLEEGDIMFLGSGADDPLYLTILYKTDGPENRIIQAQMNVKEFHRHYIEPAVREILEGFELEWTVSDDSGSRFEDRNVDGRFSLERYRFSPLAALSGRIYREERDMRMRLPSPFYISTPLIMKNDHYGNEEETVDGELGENFFRKPRPFQDEREQILLAGRADGPFYLLIERKNALDWLQSMLLLLGIGAIFLILMIQQSRLRQLREREKEFVASMTHELRTPLTVIRSASDNLRKGIITPERLPQYGTLIRDQVLRLSTMIEEILMFSSMEGKLPPIEPVETELPVLLDELERSVDAMTSETHITLHWDREGLPSPGLGDPDLIRLGLNNLIVNGLNHAYPAGEEGVIKIKIHYSIPGTLNIVVEDEGRGILPGEQKKIFQPFYRDRISRQNQEKGSGLGLYIAGKKAEAAGGELKLESPYIRVDGKKQTGCRFTLLLPYTPIDTDSLQGEPG